MIRFIVTSIALLFCFSTMVFANPVDELVEIKANTPLEIKSDRAYFLFRMKPSMGMQPTFLRIPTATELEAYDRTKRETFLKVEPELNKERDNQILKQNEAKKAGKIFKGTVPPVPSLENFYFNYFDIQNRQNIDIGQAYIKAKPSNTYLIEAIPGKYVLYGAGYKATLATCLCLGTVGFVAEPGVITDLGEIFIREAVAKSDIPELAGETGLGPSVNLGHVILFAVALKPKSDATTVPASLPKDRIQSADYHAVGTYVTSAAININHLAPIPGILAYQSGKVIDVKSGKEALGPR